jgi:N-acetylmuramoyl-L-alanine amidase
LCTFQEQRGLVVSGVCDEVSWRAIVEASWKLGDRLLVLVAPQLRGDDVGELQALLARIGFDPGRVDGIFGPSTARALEDFQHNSGLSVDGVAGTDTIRALQVLNRQTGTGPGISALRELEHLTATSRVLADLRVVIGQFGGLSALSRQLVQALRHRGATVVASDEPDASAQAAAANRFAATLYIGFESRPGAEAVVHYYRVPQFESAGGRALAERVAAAWASVPGIEPPRIQGMRLPVLRETRMPAVLVTVGAVQPTLDHAAGLVDVLVHALESWAREPVLSPTRPPE